jgi:hypothetical protein
MLLPQAWAGPKQQEASLAPEAAANAERRRSARREWMGPGCCAGRKALDVLACVRCGGRRRMLAYVTAPDGGRSIVKHLQLPTRPDARC